MLPNPSRRESGTAIAVAARRTTSVSSNNASIRIQFNLTEDGAYRTSSRRACGLPESLLGRLLAACLATSGEDGRQTWARVNPPTALSDQRIGPHYHISEQSPDPRQHLSEGSRLALCLRVQPGFAHV